MNVRLTAEQLARAEAVGRARVERARRNGWQSYYESRVSELERGIEGACAELAVAVALGDEDRWVQDPNAFRDKPDVAPDIEVRWSTRKGGPLSIYPKDRLEGRRFVLVNGHRPDFTIIGWAHGSKAIGLATSRYHKPPHAWEVPRSHLRPFGTLEPVPALFRQGVDMSGQGSLGERGTE